MPPNHRRCLCCRRVGLKESFVRIMRLHPSHQIAIATPTGRIDVTPSRLGANGKPNHSNHGSSGLQNETSNPNLATATEPIATEPIATEPIAIQVGQTAMGRSAYLCLSRDCIKQAQKKNRLGRSLKVNLPGGFYDQLSIYAESSGRLT